MESPLPVMHEIKRERFASKWTIAFLIALVILVLILLFPKQDIIGDIYRQSSPSIVTAEYLGDLLVIYPRDPKLHLLLIEEYLKLNELKKAEMELQFFDPGADNFLNWRKQWLQYQLQRAKVLAIPEKNPSHAVATEVMKKEMSRLASAPLTSKELLELAQNTMALGEMSLTKNIYHRLNDFKETLSVINYVKTADIALAVGDYRNSAHFYFEAQNVALDQETKRHYFQKALLTLQQGDMVNDALREAELHMDNLSLDRDTLLLLVKLALAANQPHLAEMYVQRALKLK